MVLRNKPTRFFAGLIEQLRARFGSIWSSGLAAKLAGELQEHEILYSQHLSAGNPYRERELDLLEAERDFRCFGGSQQAIEQDLANYQQLVPQLDASFWQSKLQQLYPPPPEPEEQPAKPDSVQAEEEELPAESQQDAEQAQSADQQPVDSAASPQEEEGQQSDEALTHQEENAKILRRNVQESWREDYQQLVAQWELQEIEAQRAKLLQQYQQRLEAIEQISQALAGLDCGRLWDLSTGTLSKQDLAQLIQWASYLRESAELQRLCQLLGRIRREGQRQETIKIQTTERYQCQRVVVDSKEEIASIKLGSDLENVVPRELVNFVDPDMEMLFYLNFVEHRLLCFATQGYQSYWQEEQGEREVTVSVPEKAGPMIVCVDTSGSMSGVPETVAKALALRLASEAAEQQRPCYLINFSTEIETMDLQPPKGLAHLIAFLQKSFHGGTDLAPALDEAVSKMEQDDYARADLLVISDFVLSIEQSSLREAITQLKSRENRFYALSIGSFPTENIDPLFDDQWHYDPGQGTVAQLLPVGQIAHLRQREIQG